MGRGNVLPNNIDLDTTCYKIRFVDWATDLRGEDENANETHPAS